LLLELRGPVGSLRASDLFGNAGQWPADVRGP